MIANVSGNPRDAAFLFQIQRFSIAVHAERQGCSYYIISIVPFKYQVFYFLRILFSPKTPKPLRGLLYPENVFLLGRRTR